MKTVERWWNGQWGRLVRRDIWLKTDGTTWRVEARKGDGDSKVWGRDFGPDETAARTLVAEMKARGWTEWQQLRAA